DDSIEFGKLGEEIDILVDAGFDGIYSNGTAGEFHNQTEEEFDIIQAEAGSPNFRRWRDAAYSRSFVFPRWMKDQLRSSRMQALK
ncbi:hypothetical protein ACC685_37750, partial [Rhizobium ruizarguesonis]